MARHTRRPTLLALSSVASLSLTSSLWGQSVGTALAWSSGTQTDASQFDGESFDYVIIGAGLGGMVMANRLSADGNTTVLVLEAGQDNRNDQAVYDIYAYGQAFDTSLDWAWQTTSGKTIRGGKTLGGSTSINGLAWTRGSKSWYNALPRFFDNSTTAQSLWNWDSLFAAMKKAEGLSPPNDQQKAKGASVIEDYHGPISNPVQVTYPDEMFGGPQQPAFFTVTGESFGIPQSKDADGGDAAVVAYHLDSIDWQAGEKRSSSATAYWSPIEGSRSNIAVLAGQTATKINFSGSDGNGNQIATGVTFGSSSNDGSRYTVNANKEIILAAGAIQSPKLLQLSGIGDSDLLNKVGVDVVVDLKGVGKNLQEQTIDSVGWTNTQDFGGKGPSDVIAFPDFKRLFTNNASTVQCLLDNSLSRYASEAADAGAAVSADAAMNILQVQRDLTVDGGIGVVEYFFDSGFPNGGLGIDLWQMLPFSRGYVAITSNDPFTYPQIDPRYFAADYDLAVQVEGCRQARKIFQTSPLSDIVSSENSPGFNMVPNDQDGGAWGDWANWITGTFASVHHPISTCMMANEKWGGVVDEQLKVYHTSNVRVVDASVMPMEVSAHLSSTLYGMAELAAEIMLGQIGN